jgi:hypothetical protein
MRSAARLGHWVGASVCAMVATQAAAYTVSISSGSPRTIYLQVGVGSFLGGNFNSGGTPQANPTVNLVSVTVPTAVVGNSAAQAMQTNTGATSSFWDGFAFCNANQLYVGGFYRFTSNASGAAATLTANSSAPLVNASGNTIPFTQIRWTSSGNGDSGTQPFAGGTFNGTASQFIGNIARNQWAESCLSFSYINAAIPAAGTYTGTVTYTLSAP